jgi:peroxiredoxin
MSEAGRGRGAGRLLPVLVAGLLLTGCGARDPAVPAAGGSSGTTGTTGTTEAGTTVIPTGSRRAVPDVSGRALDGTRVALRQLTGSGVVVINVWASWCTSCREESAAIAAVAEEMRTSPVRFVGIDEQDPPSSARHFLATTGSTYPQLADPQGELLHALSLLPQTGIPSTLLLDSRGRMAARVIGPVTQQELERLIRAAA